MNKVINNLNVIVTQFYTFTAKQGAEWHHDYIQMSQQRNVFAKIQKRRAETW